jgi:CBS domain containing-hemolysin-like protein
VLVSGVVGLVLVAVLILANGLFVAAEFALVSVRRPVVEELAAAGDRRALMVTRELSDLSFALSAAQFGITATSLLVGFIAERAIGDTVIRPLLDIVGLPPQAAVGVAVTGAFLVSTVLQMVLGELFPKNLAISRPLPVALAVTPFSRGFGVVLGPAIRIFDRSAQLITEKVFRVDVAAELEGGHSLDELARIINASGHEGSLSEEQTDLLRRAVGLGDRRVGEVMIPRPDVVFLPADGTLADLREAARTTGHSRFPIQDGSEDDVLGSVHVKDLLGVPFDRHGSLPLTSISVPMLAVPESELLRRLLTDLRREHRTSALVVDEYGGTAGVVTLEDVLEELVGDIEDEFDQAGHQVRRLGAGRHLVRGSLRADRVEHVLGEALPEGEYETVAGFVLDQLGHIPEPGERVSYGSLEFTVTRMDGVRVTELTARKLPPSPVTDAHDGPGASA